MQVNTKPKSSIFLSNQHHSTGPWPMDWLLPPPASLGDELHLLIQVGFCFPIPFLERWGVCNFNIVFQNFTFTQIQIILVENISRGNQIIFGCAKVWFVWLCLHLACRQLRFSLYSAAVTTKALTLIVFLYYPLPLALLSILCLIPLA